VVNVSGVGILAAQSSDLDALTLVEFLVSDQAQQYFVKTTFEYPLVPGITSPEGLPPLSELLRQDSTFLICAPWQTPRISCGNTD